VDKLASSIGYKLAVTNAEGCLDAFSVCVVELVAFPFLFHSFTIF